MKKQIILIAALFSFSLLACAQRLVVGTVSELQRHDAYTPSFKRDGSSRRIDNVILMIGDGMGLSHVNAAMFANGGVLTMTNLRVSGLVRTQSGSSFITDSGASATAYATGTSTHNNAIGVDMQNHPLKNMTEVASSHGYATGVLTTDLMSGATPSAFFAHQENRKNTRGLWNDLAGSHLNFFSGGSRETLDSIPVEISGRIRAAFEVVHTRGAYPRSGKLGYLPPQAECGSIDNPARKDFLPATTRYAMDYLDAVSKKGFFLMVEGARIDKTSHKNDFPATVKEVLDFDQAVEAAIRFAEADGHTLVIITADHETGAMSVPAGNPAKQQVTGAFASVGHSPVTVPLFAYGPGSYWFSGVHTNAQIGRKLMEILSK